MGEKPGGAEDEQPRDCVEEGPLEVVCFLRFFLEGDGVVDELVLVPGEEPLVAPWTGGGGGAPRCAWSMRSEAMFLHLEHRASLVEGRQALAKRQMGNVVVEPRVEAADDVLHQIGVGDGRACWT